MPKASLRIADEFSNGLSHIYSEKLLARIYKVLQSLVDLPEIGSANVRQSLVDRYGANLRKVFVSTFVIIYRYENNTVDVLALVYGPSVV